MIRLNRRWLGGLMFAVVFPSTAQAQIVARSFDELQQILKVDETIVITDESGRQTKGKVAGVSAASLTILTPEKQIFLERGVAQISRTDSLWNGALIGAGVGAAAFGLGWGSCVYHDVGCEIWGTREAHPFPSASCSSFAVAWQEGYRNFSVSSVLKPGGSVGCHASFYMKIGTPTAAITPQTFRPATSSRRTP
jgi:hypothetical protein